jgi:hypothetical protein
MYTSFERNHSLKPHIGADICSSKNISLNAYHANHNHDLVIVVIIQHRESRSRYENPTSLC